MNKDKVKNYITECIKIYREEFLFENDGEQQAFNGLFIEVYPQSFGRVDICISTDYGIVIRSGICRYEDVDDLLDKFYDHIFFGFYRDFYRNHS